MGRSLIFVIVVVVVLLGSLPSEFPKRKQKISYSYITTLISTMNHLLKTTKKKGTSIHLSQNIRDYTFIIKVKSKIQ